MFAKRFSGWVMRNSGKIAFTLVFGILAGWVANSFNPIGLVSDAFQCNSTPYEQTGKKYIEIALNSGDQASESMALKRSFEALSDGYKACKSAELAFQLGLAYCNKIGIDKKDTARGRKLLYESEQLGTSSNKVKEALIECPAS